MVTLLLSINESNPVACATLVFHRTTIPLSKSDLHFVESVEKCGTSLELKPVKLHFLAQRIFSAVKTTLPPKLPIDLHIQCSKCCETLDYFRVHDT